MENQLLSSVLEYANSLFGSNRLPVAVFDYADRDFAVRAPCVFCQNCDAFLTGKCDYKVAHSYGCFEAERWKGMYIYHCPLSLVFIATVIYTERQPVYALVSGPVIMGQWEDFVEAHGEPADLVLQLARKTPEEINGIAKIQWAVGMYLSERNSDSSKESVEAQKQLHNSLYDITSSMRSGRTAAYPVDLEKRLQKMIVNGDKEGARELINQLLSILYFHTDGDLEKIKARARELVIVFSRASIEGGADASEIFVQNRGYQAEFERVSSLDELSVLLTSIFHRFVSYAFDFGRFKHADIIHKTINYVREHYSEKITLEIIAEYVGLSRSYLSTIFKDELEMTFTDFVNKVRVEKSEILLLDPNVNLSEIAVLVGFSDQSYFTKIFTKITGVSPGQYRRTRGRDRVVKREK